MRRVLFFIVSYYRIRSPSVYWDPQGGLRVNFRWATGKSASLGRSGSEVQRYVKVRLTQRVGSICVNYVSFEERPEEGHFPNFACSLRQRSTQKMVLVKVVSWQPHFKPTHWPWKSGQ